MREIHRTPGGRMVAMATVLAQAALLSLSPAPAQASDNGVLQVMKSALYGGVAGLLLGGVLTLVVDSDSRDDVVRWGVVLGTFGGFAYGIYDLSSGSSEFTLHPAACPGPGSENGDLAWSPPPQGALALGRTELEPVPYRGLASRIHGSLSTPEGRIPW